MTNKKTSNKVGRTKNTQYRHEIWKEFLEEIRCDELYDLIENL